MGRSHPGRGVIFEIFDKRCSKFAAWVGPRPALLCAAYRLLDRMGRIVNAKVCVITGGTDGIGKAAAHGLAIQGARLLVHGRDPDKGARAVASSSRAAATRRSNSWRRIFHRSKRCSDS